MTSSVVLRTLPTPDSFRVPPRLEGLRRVSYNLWWSWHPEAHALFRRIHPERWIATRNPVAICSGPIDWEPLLEDPKFLTQVDEVVAAFDNYMAGGSDHWFPRAHGADLTNPIAYFCAEFGWHESLTLYSGGLGVLAGDHMKAASDMALPLVGVGLLYRRGYFRQAIDADGHQEHAYPEIDLSLLPLARAAGPTGEQLVVSIPLGDRRVSAAVWVAQIGRVPVLLLDTDISMNNVADRPITHILYVRGREMRLHQEMVLGVGGIRALRALGIDPSVYHLNEGHSALNLVERTREFVAAGETLDSALNHVKRHTVFTIHTPVSAGNEKFAVDLVRRVVGPLCDGTGEADAGGVPLQRMLDLAVGAEGDRGAFDLTALSLRLSVGANAVSKLHAETANNTWSPVITNKILGITNGVHMPTWVGRETRVVYEQFLNADLDRLDTDGPEAAGFWERLGGVDARAWWDAHGRQKVALGEFLRDSIRRQLGRHGEAPDALREADHFFDPNVLTIGFARRFATYKRANLLFTDIERLTRILSNSDRPVQIVFAGKAHPADRAGQEVIRDIWEKSRTDAFRGRIFVMEDYDMRTTRYLVAGCDVWLNTPRRPLEASGTSGMKASANGAVNVSILDGWWDEGYTGTNGFAIGDTSISPDDAAQDAADAESLYRILENEVVPRYYDRGADGLPAAWLDLARASIGSTLWRFSTTRMLHEYCEQLYLPAAAAPQTGSHR